MTDEQFFIILSQNVYIFTILLIPTVTVGIILYRKYIYSLIDPLFYHIITSFSGFTIVFFLYFLHYIESKYLYSFLLTEAAFIVGFFTIKPIKKPAKCQIIDKLEESMLLTDRIKVLFLISFFLFIFSTLFIYYVRGVPLLERLAGHAAFQGGLGIFARINLITSWIILLYLCIKIFVIKKLTILDKLCILITILFMSLSGSKASFVSFLFAYFFVYIFLWRFNTTIRISKKAISAVILLLILTGTIIASYLYSTNITEGFYKLFMRIVLTGDIYFFSYPNGVIDSINIENGNIFSALFGGTLAGMKIIPWEEVPDLVGHTVAGYVYGAYDLPFSPNSRHNVFGYYYLGFWGSVIFSFLLGIITSFIRNYLYYKVRKNIEGLFIYSTLSISCLSFESDPPYAIFKITSFIFIFIPIFLFSIVISEALKQSKILTLETRLNKFRKNYGIER